LRFNGKALVGAEASLQRQTPSEQYATKKIEAALTCTFQKRRGQYET
jgi:hypothetical protein